MHRGGEGIAFSRPLKISIWVTCLVTINICIYTWKGELQKILSRSGFETDIHAKGRGVHHLLPPYKKNYLGHISITINIFYTVRVNYREFFQDKGYRNTWILWQVINYRQFRLLTWNSCIGQFVCTLGEEVMERRSGRGNCYFSPLRVSLYLTWKYGVRSK